MTVFALCSRRAKDLAYGIWTDFKTLKIYFSKDVVNEDLLYLRKDALDRNCCDVDFEVLEFVVRDSTFFKE